MKLLWRLVTPRQLRFAVLVVLLVWFAIDIAHHSGVFDMLIELLTGAAPHVPGQPRQIPTAAAASLR